jgi:transposase-like protein
MKSFLLTVIEELKQERVLGRRCRCHIVPYLNNVVEQDHRSISPDKFGSSKLPSVSLLSF